MALQPEQQARGKIEFSEEYIVQRLQGNQIDTTARVCICTIQRMYSMLKGRDLLPDLHANGGGRVWPRSTNPMTSSHC
ncbi:MAG: hypothetical protein K0M66_03275 [Thiobacillus sp.]|nr:hypothetical protein [Thiobacillus sp.]